MFHRSSGVLAHVTSLPSPHGVGTMGKSAYEFVDFLAAAHQTYWQVLPLGHTGFGDSPYQCFSAAAGNPYLIDLDLLVEDGLLTEAEVKAGDFEASPDTADFEQLADTRWPLFRKAYSRIDDALREKIHTFTEENAEWLPDYALFMALKEEKYQHMPVYMWPEKAVRDRKPEALKKVTEELRDEIDFRIFLQYIFFTQWKALREYANEHGIQIIGDIPIYVSADSVDVWTHPALFKLKTDLSPKLVAGVPPDYYSATGQLWGNPVYDWDAHRAEGFSWWIWRMKSNMALFDVVRLDHFRGFAAYWEVRATEETAIKGHWRKGPGMELFHAMEKALGPLPLIAEDLGEMTDEVRELLAESGFPGMKVLIFGFTPDCDNEHLPHNFVPNSIVYTSTHDSQTVCEQIMDICTEPEKQFAYRYLRTSHSEAMGWSAIKSVWASPAHITMTTLQDLLSLGADARMNTPATIGGKNWRWRVRKEALNATVSAMLGEITRTYMRG
ncbi:MAG TPA: 4-alpha-glucanotransferase [Candidatus Agathobaculum pullicola]|nr:4-alpha-glucanotransferase [Candidatus Agathobaculum pullicola]